MNARGALILRSWQEIHGRALGPLEPVSPAKPHQIGLADLNANDACKHDTKGI